MDPRHHEECQAAVDREIHHLRELIERTMAEKDVALDLQRKEYHRRLEELNNAHARAEKTAEHVVPRETFDNFVEGYATWKRDIDAKLSRAEAVSAANAKFFAAVVAIVGLIFSAITIWMRSK